MKIQIIILIVLIIPVVVALIGMLRKGFSFSRFFSLLFSTMILVGGIFLYLDTTDFQKNFSTSKKMFILEKDNDILCGFEGVLTSETEKPAYIDASRLGEIQNAYQKKDLAAVKGSTYKLFIVSTDTFRNIGEFKLGDDKLPFDYVMSLLNSNTPVDDYVEHVIKERGIEGDVENVEEEYRDVARDKFKEELAKIFGDDAQFKGGLFAMMLSEATKKEGQAFLINKYKDGKIKVYEETLLFRLIKFIPSSIIQKLTQSSAGA